MDLTKFYPEKFSYRTAYKYIIYSYYFKDLTPRKTIAEKFAEKIMIKIDRIEHHPNVFGIGIGYKSYGGMSYSAVGSPALSPIYIFQRPINIDNGKNYPFPFLVKELLSQSMSEAFK